MRSKIHDVDADADADVDIFIVVYKGIKHSIGT